MNTQRIARRLQPVGICALTSLCLISRNVHADDLSSATGAPCEALSEAIVATSGNVYLNAGARVDSYQSSLGAYGGSNIGSDATILAGGALVNNGGAFQGTALPSTASTLAVLPAPSNATPLPLGSAAPGDLNINNAAGSITLAPGSYVVKNLNVNFPGAINVLPGGPVLIWVTGNLNLGGNENLNGVPENLEFLVTSSGWVNVNSSGSLVGTIYAPTSGVNLNSTVFGSVVGSTVALNSGSAVHYDQGLACTVAGATPPRSLPTPPDVVGCYVWGATDWVTVPCMAPEDVAKLPHPAPNPMVDIHATPVPVSTTAPQPSVQIPFAFGQLETTFLGVNSETSHCPTSGPYASDCQYDKTANALSVQGNTNFFPCVNGDCSKGGYWVQFVIQSNGQSTDVCIWNIDVKGQDYSQTWCVDSTPDMEVEQAGYFPILQRTSGFQPYDYANLSARIVPGTAAPPPSAPILVNGKPWTHGTVLALATQFTWVAERTSMTYAVVTPDVYGLAGNWHDLSGGLVGIGGGNKASFASTEVVTRIVVSDNAADRRASDPSYPPSVGGTSFEAPDAGPGILSLADYVSAWPASTSAHGSNDVTAETSNLTPLAGAPKITPLNYGLVATEYVSSTTGACLPTSASLYVKDNVDDNAGIPSNPLGEGVSNSPDIFVVPQGSHVDTAAFSSETLITPGQRFDAYVRVHNEFDCADVHGAQALVSLATENKVLFEPFILHVDTAVSAYEPGGGVTVRARSKRLLGPFTFTAPTNVETAGEWTLVAGVTSATQGPPFWGYYAPLVGGPVYTEYSNQVAQRNVQFGSACQFPLTNATMSTSAGNLQLKLNVTYTNQAGHGIMPVQPSIAVSDVGQDWYDELQSCATWELTSQKGYTVVTPQLPEVSLSGVTLPAGTSRTVTVLFPDPTAIPPDMTVTLTLSGTLTAGKHQYPVLTSTGMSCQVTGVLPPR